MPHNESFCKDNNLVNYNPGTRAFNAIIKELYRSDKNSKFYGVNSPELFTTPKEEVKADLKIVKKDEEDIKTDNIKIQDDNKTITILEHIMTTNLSNSHDIKAFVKQMENEILNVQRQEQKLSNKINLDISSINNENKDITKLLPLLITDNNITSNKVELFSKNSSNLGNTNQFYKDQIDHISTNSGDLLTKLNQ